MPIDAFAAHIIQGENKQIRLETARSDAKRSCLLASGQDGDLFLFGVVASHSNTVSMKVSRRRPIVLSSGRAECPPDDFAEHWMYMKRRPALLVGHIRIILPPLSLQLLRTLREDRFVNRSQHINVSAETQ